MRNCFSEDAFNLSKVSAKTFRKLYNFHHDFLNTAFNW